MNKSRTSSLSKFKNGIRKREKSNIKIGSKCTSQSKSKRMSKKSLYKLEN